MNRKFIIVFSMALFGCHMNAARRAALQDNDAAIDRINQECNKHILADGTPLIHDWVSSDQFQQTYITINCDGKVNESCANKFFQMKNGLWLDRYPAADLKEVHLQSMSFPGKIDDRTYELLLFKSHNERVRKLCEEKRVEVRNNTRQQLNTIAQQEAENQAQFQRVMQSLSRKDENVIKCTSTTIGDSVHTTCSNR